MITNLSGCPNPVLALQMKEKGKSILDKVHFHFARYSQGYLIGIEFVTNDLLNTAKNLVFSCSSTVTTQNVPNICSVPHHVILQSSLVNS